MKSLSELLLSRRPDEIMRRASRSLQRSEQNAQSISICHAIIVKVVVSQWSCENLWAKLSGPKGHASPVARWNLPGGRSGDDGTNIYDYWALSHDEKLRSPAVQILSSRCSC